MCKFKCKSFHVISGQDSKSEVAGSLLNFSVCPYTAIRSRRREVRYLAEIRRKTQDTIGLLGWWDARVQAAHSDQPAAIRLALENTKRCSLASRFPLFELCKGPSHITRAAKLDNLQPLAIAAFFGPFSMLCFDFFPSAGCRAIGRHHLCIG